MHSMYGERGRVCKSGTKTSRRRKLLGRRELTWINTITFHLTSESSIRQCIRIHAAIDLTFSNYQLRN
jgi:hypothetical protein